MECKGYGHFTKFNIALECSCGEMTSFYLEEVEGWVLVACSDCAKEYEFRSTMFVEMRERAEEE